eukprot:scaffold32495_cov60-Phaeocystis_antarctica.AAC.10
MSSAARRLKFASQALLVLQYRILCCVCRSNASGTVPLRPNNACRTRTEWFKTFGHSAPVSKSPLAPAKNSDVVRFDRRSASSLSAAHCGGSTYGRLT